MGSKRKRNAAAAATASNEPSNKRSKTTTDLPPAAANGTANGTATKPTKTAKNALDKSPFTEHLTVEERKRELGLYELLGSEDPADRINAADAIISGLLGGEGVPEPVLLRHLEHRLFRGLASGRNASRLGFSLVLTEILGQLFGEKELLAAEKYTGLTFDKVLGILIAKTSAAGGGGGLGGGQQERDNYFGQLFGIECFVRGDILFTDKSRWMSVLEILVKLGQKKSWLKAQCGWIIAQAVASYMKKQKLVEMTLEKLAEEGFAKTPEGVGIWISALDRWPEVKLSSAAAKQVPWKGSHPLAVASLAALPAVLKDSGRDTSNDNQQDGGKKKPKQGNWTAQLHFVWDLILAHFSKLGKLDDGADAAEQFKQFWNRVVDEGFFSKSSSDSQKFSGFMIFQKMLEGAAACPFILDSLFSKNLMACLMNQASKEDRYLHRAALKALKAIEPVAEANPSFVPIILKQLLTHNGVYNFDQRTNTKTVDKILQYTTPATIKPVVKILRLKDPSKSGLDESKYYQALGSYLFRLASAPSESDEDSVSSKSVPGSAIKLLTDLAYSNKSVPADIKEALRTRTTAAFARLVRRPEDFGHLCNAILSIEADVDPEDEIAGLVLPQAYERLKDLLDPSKEPDAPRAPRQALALLYAVGILQFYNEDPDVMDQFEELDECYAKLAGESMQDEEGISEYLVEILLAMVARPSSLMRQVSQQVFAAFTGLMSADALKLLTDPLAADESAKGQQALFSTEDEDMHDAEDDDGEEDGSDDEEGLDSDVEIVDLEDAGSDDDDEDASDDGNSDEGDDDAAEKDQEDLEALDNALAEVLGSHRLDKDAEAADSDEHGSDMTDSEMMAVDEKLAEIFKQRAKTTSKKKEKKDAKDTVVNFKHRVLDLLAIFVKNEAAAMNPLTFDALLPLLHLIRTTTTKPLANKACETILNFSAALKKARNRHNAAAEAEAPEMGTDALLELLGEIHGEASKDLSHAFTKAVSTASLAIASILCADDEDVDKTDKVFELYTETQKKWFKGEVKIQTAFFSDWLNWCQSHASTAAAAAAAP
ncbi:DNA polymerase phi-domain-containing protein [Apodospora peruviana]|uniref:DNA polymerase phi-domain-containing protein n=1 Tax=Apodospora peruviana TaxID=516989 RepID=A0AAE0IR73_9PEZI|nr:DNA polymerase phi-domain-containing protein [Apodospora peruviana]